MNGWMNLGTINGVKGLVDQYAGDAFAGLSTVGLVTILVFGALQCFFGYKLMKLWLFLIGAVLGGLGGYLAGGALTDSQGWAACIAVAAALITGMLSFWIYQAGIFLLCCVTGTLVFSLLFRPNSSLLFFGCILLGAALGFLGVKFVRPIVVVSTALQGGLTVGEVLMPLMGLSDGKMGLVIGIFVTLAGLVFQWMTTGKNREKKIAAWERKQERQNRTERWEEAYRGQRDED